MIKPQLVRAERYYLRFKCPYCNYEWDSETKSLKRISCSRCKCSLRAKSGWPERPQPRYYAIDPDTGKATEIFPSNARQTTESVNDNDSDSRRRGTRSKKENTNVKSKSE